MEPSADHSKQPVSREWVLVVDDDQPIRDLVADFLMDSGLQIVGANEGSRALELLASRSDEPVLVLVDVLMPGIDGLTLARKLKSRLKQGMIVVMSGHMSDLSWWPAELRDVEFLPKPFRLAELQEVVARARAAFPRQG